MAVQKKRYKAVIDHQTYTIIGTQSTQHMDMVTQLVNDQLQELYALAPQMEKEQAAILMAINAISDQLIKQEEILQMEQKLADLKGIAIRATELENKLKRIEAIEKEAKAVLEKNGQKDVTIHNHLEAQHILNEERKRTIKEKTAHT
ncbi:cell division protein ZapA [Enterococcus camelliae]|uniref:Cell division protein ZapA n=1 Tax=Enterococcus camelliae TaxID=453959 RepID=A0ABW5TLE0_9ENTE